MVDFSKTPDSSDDARTPAPFGEPFDYDATAEASLSEMPATSDAEPSHGPGGASGPGWDTFSGVGNGPGWGSAPSYPAPSYPAPSNPAPGSPADNYPVINPTETYPTAGLPTSGFPTASYPAPGHIPGAEPVYPQQVQPQTGNPQAGYPQQGYPQPGYPQQGYPQPGYPQQGFYPAYNQPGYPAGYPAQPYGFGAVDAPYGRDPATGIPLSDKSKVVAGLLQIFLGGFGAGRFYIGSNGVAVAQLLTLILGWLTAVVFVGVFILGGLAVWVVVDGILMLVGNVKDGNGRKLRD